jgi:Dolichyl-phosphate-mannose-protein mannosyltransferase
MMSALVSWRRILAVSRKSRYAAVLPFLLAVLLLDLSSMRGMSATYDEGGHLAFGQSVIERRSIGPSAQKMAITLVNYLPLYVLDLLGLDVSAPTSLFVARLPSVVASLTLVLLVFGWTRRLYGLRGALVSATLCTLCPTVIAHGRLVTNDIYCACLMFAATMMFVEYLRAPTHGRLIGVAGIAGLAQLTKHTALLLVPIFAVLWSVDALRAARDGRTHAAPRARRVRRFVLHGAMAVAVALLVMNAGYLFGGTLRSAESYLTEYRALPVGVRNAPALAAIAALAAPVPSVRVPLPYLYVYALITGIQYNATGAGHGPIYLMGEVSERGWWYYFLVAFALKTPLAVMLLLAGAIAVSPRWFGKQPLDELALLTAVVVIFAFFSFACTAQLGIRYVLPAFPFLFVFVGKVAASAPRRHPIPYHAALGILLVWAGASSLSFHPHYVSYFNELIGDRKNMWKYLADSNVDWGQSNEYLLRYLVAQGPGRVTLNPEAPMSGRVIVNVNVLVGVSAPRQKYAWLRERFEPARHVAYSWLVYDVP